MQEVDSMLKSKKNKKTNMNLAMADRASKRRSDWVDFHATELFEDEDHEKKIRFNYFMDSTMTNPGLYDFRPNSIDVKHKR